MRSIYMYKTTHPLNYGYTSFTFLYTTTMNRELNLKLNRIRPDRPGDYYENSYGVRFTTTQSQYWEIRELFAPSSEDDLEWLRPIIPTDTLHSHNNPSQLITIWALDPNEMYLLDEDKEIIQPITDKQERQFYWNQIDLLSTPHTHD